MPPTPKHSGTRFHIPPSPDSTTLADIEKGWVFYEQTLALRLPGTGTTPGEVKVHTRRDGRRLKLDLTARGAPTLLSLTPTDLREFGEALAALGAQLEKHPTEPEPL